jgi:hypothetical protein
MKKGVSRVKIRESVREVEQERVECCAREKSQLKENRDFNRVVDDIQIVMVIKSRETYSTGLSFEYWYVTSYVQVVRGAPCSVQIRLGTTSC